MSSYDVFCISPFGRPDADIVRAAYRAGALGVLDLGDDAQAARRAVGELVARGVTSFGVRVASQDLVGEVPSAATVVLAGPGVDATACRAPGRAVIAQVTSIAEARAAIDRGADGLVVKGSESGGVVGEETSFVLLQRVVAADLGVPIWVQGGVGLHTAAACLAGGATGVVLDVQLSLARESSISPDLARALMAVDGSETVVEGGRRVLSRPGVPAVAAGQDIAFARTLAERHVTVGGIVTAIRASARRHLELAREHRPVAPGSPLAVQHGSTYPIVQGPMTRVSDRAAFADAIASSGGLPFIAVALLRGGELSNLLAETKARLGSRPWGVGILGFVPDEIRAEQLEAVLRVRPPLAIVAGGRPSQARPLEEAGVATYLHVPSPGLLDLFLDDGARRFVFEGRECGGHVGPRTSFVLWETQIERLLAFAKPEELSVLFAGGIHDARSAAMVAAMAAPLAALGAKIGVLMGTAYLFTHEAVATGAIGRAFQDAALACSTTALLETAPGHATRCAETPFVDDFRAEKRRLEGEGASGERLWEALERMNLGRLRLASKGLVREGAALANVDEPTQRERGLFMIGQVAALRSTTCSMAELHHEVSAGATELLSTAASASPGERPDPVDVAIVGMACIFPGAEDLSAFWSNVVEGVDSVTTVPEARWSVEKYFDAKSSAPDKTPSKWGGFIPPIRFDPRTYGIPPRSLASIDPVQLLSLEVARRALEDAGYAARAFDRSRTSVVFGAEAGTDLSAAYGFRALWPEMVGVPMPDDVAARMPTPTEDSFPGVLSNVIAGRIANRLDLGGSNYTIDAACAASLAALDVAVKELRSRTSDMVLCGGADLHNGIHDYLMFASVHALSASGRCRTFDASADGIALGEGVACLVLKRLADAERDGDRVYAVVSAVAASSDGRSLGLTAPRKEGQRLALDRAYARAGVSPAEIGLVEAHGTGTVVGDRTELACLTEVYTAAGALPGSVALGSVKSQIGHTKCAAGMAGLIKAALSVHRGVLPPTLHVRAPNEAWDPSSSPFQMSAAARPWTKARRAAAVSAFGFGGTNYHAVLRRHDPTEPDLPGADRWPAELFLFRGETRDHALRTLETVARAVSSDGDAPRLVDLALSTSGAGRGPVQIAVVASTVADLRAKLATARTGAEAEGVFARKAAGGGRPGVAFLFPGQGSQRPGMLADVFVAFPAARSRLGLGPEYVGRMLPPPARSPQERAAQAAALTETTVAQPALGMADLAMATVLSELGVRPDVVGGHSFGELVALVVAGVLREEDLVPLSEARARAILDAAGADPGAMLAVSAGPEAIEPLLDASVVIANHNAPDQTVVAGPTRAIEKTAARLEAAGLAPKRLPVACAFHSPLVAGAKDALARALAAIPVASPRTRVLANATAEAYPDDPGATRALLASQVARPVLFHREIEAMYGAGARVFVEVGPGRVLTGLVGRILAGRDHAAIACDESGQHGITRLLVAVGEMASLGVDVDARALFEGRGAVEIDPAAAVRAPASAMAVLVDGSGVRPIGSQPGARDSVPPPSIPPLSIPPPAPGAVGRVAPTLAPPAPPTMRPASLPPAAAPSVHLVGAVAAVPDATQAVLAYLATTREMVQATKAVMLGYLGAPVASGVEAMPQLVASTHLSVSAETFVTRDALPPPAPAPVIAEELVAGAIAVASIGETLLALVSERTGYPPDMLDPDLDLEADLGVDSIKRIEILGALRARLGLAVGSTAERDKSLEQLARLKTIRGITAWLEERVATGTGSATETQTATETETETKTKTEAASGEPVRYTVRVEPAPGVRAAQLDGKRVAIAGGGDGVATRLLRMLEDSGARPALVHPSEALATDAFLDLGLLGLGVSPRPTPSRAAAELFERTRGAVLAGVPRIVAATGLGRRCAGGDPPPLAGAGGLLKSIARERSGIATTVVHLDPAAGPQRLAEQLLFELHALPADSEVAYAEGVRSQLRLVESKLRPNGKTHASLDRDSVVLLTGGARGITAHVALSLAREVGCKLEIVGRSRRPDVALPVELARATDMPALRSALLGRGGPRDASAIEAECRRIVSAREIESTLGSVAALGGGVRYHAVDVRDRESFGALIDDVYARHGRLDGVIHGAGVIEDRRLEDKTPESFLRVFETKVHGALTLAERLRPDVSFVVFFSSVASVFGNRGQADYAAANEALDRIAAWMRPRLTGRVVSINWGPWSGAGMVSSELERLYEQAGVGLIAPEAGARCLMDELLHGDPEDSQVIWMQDNLEQRSSDG